MPHCTEGGLNAALVVAVMADNVREKEAPDTQELEDLARSVIEGYKGCPSAKCSKLIKAATNAKNTPSIKTGLELAIALNTVALDLLEKSQKEVAPQGKGKGGLVSGNELEQGITETIVPPSSSAVPRVEDD
jgi:hypothetical protein